jgi:hypothetical protein
VPKKNATQVLLESAPVDWWAIVSGLTVQQRKDVVEDLADLIEAAARLHGYVEIMAQVSHHERAVNASNSGGAKARKLLLGRYPVDPISF